MVELRGGRPGNLVRWSGRQSLRNPPSKLTQPMGTRDDVWSLLELLICNYDNL